MNIPVRYTAIRIAGMLIFLLAALRLQAQQPIFVRDSAHYDQLKIQGKLQNGLNVVFPNSGKTTPLRAVIQQPAVNPLASASCQCMQTIDNTYQVVPFNFGTGPDYRNDDFSSPNIALPFNFCFYGQNQASCYINNNGNISFGAPYGTFSASGFPNNQVVMIAPFWADVDTRNLASGLVYYKVTPTYMIVRWQTVGYFSQHVDKLNDFQLIISDGTDPILPAGSNAAFCYGDMQWSTGDASLGVNGFGGIPATVGANLGDGVNYIQLGTFDQAGTFYDGPYGLNDGISWLDNQQFFFDVCNTGVSNNVPPIMQAPQVCDTFTLCVGDTFPIAANFLSPEQGQITTATITTASTGLNIISNVPGNIATISAEFYGLNSNIGYNTITISGTDNGSPARTTSGVVVLEVVPGPTAQFSADSVCPGSVMTFTDTSIPQNGNGPLTDWSWNFGDPPSGTADTSTFQNPTHTYGTSGNYDVILQITDSVGCRARDTVQVLVYPLPVIAFTSDVDSGCAPLCVNFTDQSTVLNSTITGWVWNFGNGNMDSLTGTPQNCYNADGDYTVTLTATSAEGCTFTDSIVSMIHVIPGPQADFAFGPQPVTITDPTILFTNLTTGNPSSFTWDFDDPASLDNVSTITSPTHVYSDTGNFCVTLIAYGGNGTCPDTSVQCLVISPDVNIWIPNAFTPNNNGNNDVWGPVYSDNLAIKEFEMLIFDRWGNLIFKTNDIYAGWDGKQPNNGSKFVMNDVYVYSIRIVEKYIGKEYRFLGHVSVIR